MANENMRLSAAGYTALQRNEGVVMHYYNDTGNNCTWGVGTLAHYGPCTPEELRRAVLPEQVNALLNTRVREAERIVRTTVTEQQFTQAQFDAAVSFAYNSTTYNTRRALGPANSGDIAIVARRMRSNVMVTPRDRNGQATGPTRRSRGLVNRRNRESAPFVQGTP